MKQKRNTTKGNNPGKQRHTQQSVREEVLAVITANAPERLKTNELSKLLRIKATEPEYEFIRAALEQLEEEGVIFKGPRRSYGLKIQETVVEGMLRKVGPGKWVVIPDGERQPAMRLDARSLLTAFAGDYVRAKVINIPAPDELPEGEVTLVKKRNVVSVVGTLKHGRQLYVEPDSRDFHRMITITTRHPGARIGDKVVVRLNEWHDPYNDPTGKIMSRLGTAGDMKAELASISATHSIPNKFPKEVLQEADEFPDTLTEADFAGRRDIREMDIFTIDPYDARDFDDAISVEEHEDGESTIGVHIADVSHYVREGSALDREAYLRGTSIYFVTGVIPMLPERLSNNLCSLRPDEDRLAYSVFVRLSPRGAIKEYEIAKTVIRSKRRFTYEEALEVLETGTGDYAHELQAINKLVHALRANRRRKGSIDFETTELKFKLDENNHPIEVMQKRATESTRLIEDCMLLANRVIAEHIATHKFDASHRRGGDLNPFIYRIHDSPPKDKLLELTAFVKALGYTLPVDNIQPKDVQRLIDDAHGTEHEELINQVTLRSMAKAVYSEYNIGHFGLAFKHYTHFTSPIRRYPDLIVHRMLHEYSQGMDGHTRARYAEEMGGIADHCSRRERVGVEAERESIKIAEVEFLKDHEGGVFEAVITSVMNFGMFAELRRFGIDGFISLSNIDDDYYRYDERMRAFRGHGTNRTFSIGDAIFVRVLRVNRVKSEIDLQIIDQREYEREGGVVTVASKQKHLPPQTREERNTSEQQARDRRSTSTAARGKSTGSKAGTRKSGTGGGGSKRRSSKNSGGGTSSNSSGATGSSTRTKGSAKKGGSAKGKKRRR